jgi:ABC-type dipeptide/oligopeptide/nickel transport system permease component
VATGIILLIGTAFVLINLLVDLLYPVLDPRIRLGQAANWR